ncbi:MULTISPECIES: hypothetical protein [Pandoraea]|uniref:hypothetical protein n=1 Tax=Pandoraea TaxID=93217 RepID=UPI001F5C53DF|nr:MULTISPECIES: hypothetical protein [Pandoraea]
MMGTLFGSISGAASAPVLTGGKLLPCECGSSFGSDFERLGAVPVTTTTEASGKPWQSYPERRRTLQDADGLSFGHWQACRDAERLIADDLIGRPLVPNAVSERVERWHSMFQRGIERDVSFEDGRTEAMRQVRYGVPPEPRPFIRTFDPEPVIVQLLEIAHVNDEIDRMTAIVDRVPKGPAKSMAQHSLHDMKKMRDTMLVLSTTQHDRTFNELKAERNVLIALNDMAREAQREMSNGGADVPLRLKVLGSRLILKPATSKSRFQKNHIRARNDAARLALLLGYPAGQPVTLSDIRDRGFGLYEYSTVLHSAKTASPECTMSWLGMRALEIDNWKHVARGLQDDLRETDGGRLLGAPVTPSHAVHDDSRLDAIDGAPQLSGVDEIDAVPMRTMPKEAGALGAQAAAATAVSSAQCASHGRAPTSRRGQFADQFIGTQAGRAGRLSAILEGSPSAERLAQTEPSRGPRESRGSVPAAVSRGRSVPLPVATSATNARAQVVETPEAMALRTGARPKTHRRVASPSETPPPLPLTPPPDAT